MKSRFELAEHIHLRDAEDTLALVMIAAEALFTDEQEWFGFSYDLHPLDHAITIKGQVALCTDVTKMFAGFLLKEFGASAFSMSIVGRQRAKAGHLSRNRRHK